MYVCMYAHTPNQPHTNIHVERAMQVDDGRGSTVLRSDGSRSVEENQGAAARRRGLLGRLRWKARSMCVCVCVFVCTHA
jgi:hypothetical protein